MLCHQDSAIDDSSVSDPTRTPEPYIIEQKEEPQHILHNQKEEPQHILHNQMSVSRQHPEDDPVALMASWEAIGHDYAAVLQHKYPPAYHAL